MFKPIQYHLKEFFFYLGILIGFFFLTHNILLTKHYQLDQKVLTMKKEFQALSLEEKKLRTQRNEKIERTFEKNRSHLKRYSIKKVPLVKFE